MRTAKPAELDGRLAELAEKYQNDACFGKLHDTMHPDCIHCAVNKDCGTLTGKLNLGKVMSEKGVNSNHLDISMVIHNQKNRDVLSSLPISTPDYMEAAIADLNQALEDGAEVTVKDAIEVITEACEGNITTMQKVLWLNDFYKQGNFTVEGGCIVKA